MVRPLVEVEAEAEDEEDIEGLSYSLLHSLGISKLTDKMVGRFSVGQKRAVSCAIALIGNPDLLLLRP